jgi:hypothetical protein
MASFDELHACARDRLAKSIRNAAADDDRVRRGGQQKDCGCGEKSARRELRAQRLTVRLRAPIQKIH